MKMKANDCAVTITMTSGNGRVLLRHGARPRDRKHCAAAASQPARACACLLNFMYKMKMNSIALKTEPCASEVPVLFR